MKNIDSTNHISVEEYLRNEAVASYKSEYRNGIVVPVHRTVNEHGEMVAMAGAQPAHNRLVTRLLRLLEGCLETTDCLVFASDQLVHLPECNQFVYPDVSIVCKKPEYVKSPGGLDALVNPSIIVEVLSKSTGDYDRGEKFRCYRMIPSFEQYVLVDSVERQVETITKQDDKHWLMALARQANEKVKIGSCEFEVGAIYKKVFLE